MKERTEQEICGHLPIEMTLGDKVYKVDPLPILKQREWRVQLNEVMSKVLLGFGGTLQDNAVKDAFGAALLNFPEAVADLLFAYAPEQLPKDEILGGLATEEQINMAFSKLMVVAYPFLAQLGTVTKALQMTAKLA